MVSQVDASFIKIRQHYDTISPACIVGGIRLDVNVTERDSQFAEYALGFEEYLRAHTAIDLQVPRAHDAQSLRASFEQLDLALGQIADLASVYGNDSRADIEPLTTPTAVLAGEYLRVGMGASWMEPAYEGDQSLLLATPNGIALDLEGVARSTLMSSQPNLTALVDRLLEQTEDWT